MALGVLIGQAMKHREAFEQAVVRKEFKGLAHAVKESREGNAEARASVVAAVCWAALPAPLRLRQFMISSQRLGWVSPRYR